MDLWWEVMKRCTGVALAICANAMALCVNLVGERLAGALTTAATGD